MAIFEFRLPDIGEGSAAAECVAWHVQPGDMVEEDAPLLDVMTEKATVELGAPVSGRLVEARGKVGEALAIGSVVAVFDLDGDGDGNGNGNGDGDGARADIASQGNVAADMAAPPVVEIAVSVPENAAQITENAAQHFDRVRAAPAVRKRAADLGMDLSLVPGSGPDGRVRQADLDAFLAMPRGTSSPSVAVQSFTLPRDAGPVESAPLSPLRRRIAARLQDAKQRIPHFTYVEEIDVTEVERLRASLNAEHGGTRPKLTFLPFLIRALTQALPAWPQINARFDDAAGILHRFADVHMGIATQTPAGLVVTVVRDANRRDLWGNAAEITRLADRARAGKAAPDELSGSTLTITSLGTLGGIVSTPVVNSPEVAIIGVNKIVERPVVRDGRIEIARIMNLSTSCDHRIVDGWDAASFVQDVKRRLESPARLFMEG